MDCKQSAVGAAHDLWCTGYCEYHGQRESMGLSETCMCGSLTLHGTACISHNLKFQG